MIEVRSPKRCPTHPQICRHLYCDKILKNQDNKHLRWSIPLWRWLTDKEPWLLSWEYGARTGVPYVTTAMLDKLVEIIAFSRFSSKDRMDEVFSATTTLAGQLFLSNSWTARLFTKVHSARRRNTKRFISTPKDLASACELVIYCLVLWYIHWPQNTTFTGKSAFSFLVLS